MLSHFQSRFPAPRAGCKAAGQTGKRRSPSAISNSSLSWWLAYRNILFFSGAGLWKGRSEWSGVTHFCKILAMNICKDPILHSIWNYWIFSVSFHCLRPRADLLLEVKRACKQIGFAICHLNRLLSHSVSRGWSADAATCFLSYDLFFLPYVS